MAIAPASRNESQTAAPATSPAAPRREKIPAPTIAPTPMNAACRIVKDFGGAEFGVGASVPVPSAPPSGKCCDKDCLDRMEAVLGLVEHNAGRRFEHLAR